MYLNANHIDKRDDKLRPKKSLKVVINLADINPIVTYVTELVS